MTEIIPNLHPILVHFPIVLISVSTFFHIMAIATRGKSCAAHCAVLAHTTLWLGALSALPTAFFGWQAFNSVNHDEAGHAAMLLHRSWALVTLVVLVVLAGWDAWRSKVGAIPAWWFAGVMVGACGLVAVTAWHGGELVYRHGLGVMALPENEARYVHSHEHGAVPDDKEHTHADVMPENEAHEHSHDKHTY